MRQIHGDKDLALSAYNDRVPDHELWNEGRREEREAERKPDTECATVQTAEKPLLAVARPRNDYLNAAVVMLEQADRDIASDDLWAAKVQAEAAIREVKALLKRIAHLSNAPDKRRPPRSFASSGCSPSSLE